jgi:xylitol oxidase
VRAYPESKKRLTTAADGSHVTLRNWSGTYQFTAQKVIAARSIGEVQRAVANGGRVRALGTGHSFNDLADNGATLVSVTGIAPDPVIDEAGGTVTVGAGASYGVLAAWLQDRGVALGNMGSLPHISIAGATATGTHGSGSGNQVLSAQVAGLEYVAADGELRRADRSTPGFDGMAVGLGAFGIVVRVTLDIQPSYLVRQDAYTGLPWDRALADLGAIMDAAYSVSLFTDWSGDSLRAAWVKRRVPAAPDAAPDAAAPDDTPEEFFGARREPGPVRFIEAPADNLTELGTAGPWSQRLPHFRLDSTPSNGDEIQSEYFVERRHGAAALEAVRRRAAGITPLLMISEIRATAADRLWLSGSYGRETMAIHFTWRNDPAAVDTVLWDVEAALEPFAARPHWGKVSHVTAARVAGLYPRVGDARALFERLDPDGRFAGARLERLAVREPR